MADYGPSHPWYLEAKEYWRKFRPKLYRALEKSGELEQTLRETIRMTEDACLDLMARGLQPHEARELMLTEWLFPPGEEESLRPPPESPGYPSQKGTAK